MPDVVLYVCYELLRTFPGAVASPLLISDSEFGPSKFSQRLQFRLCVLALGETGGNSNTFCFGSSGTETI